MQRSGLHVTMALLAAACLARPLAARAQGGSAPGRLPALGGSAAEGTRGHAGGRTAPLPWVVSSPRRFPGRGRGSGCPAITAGMPCPGPGRSIGLFGFAPFFYPVFLTGEPYAEPAPAVQAPSGSKLIEVAPGAAGEVLEIQRVGAGALRLTRPGGGSAVRSVRLFLGDSARRVITERSLDDPPYSTVLPLSPRTAFVGTLVTYADGTTTSTWLPYQPSR